MIWNDAARTLTCRCHLAAKMRVTAAAETESVDLSHLYIVTALLEDRILAATLSICKDKDTLFNCAAFLITF